jgi:hypothetical protein
MLDVQRITADNTVRMRTQPLLPWGQVGAGLVLLSLAAYATMMVFRWRRNRFRISPSEVARLLEGTDPPAILDVRESTAYERSPVRIPRSLRVSVEDLSEGGKRPDVDRGRLVVAYCT